jgi:hypothetical protein
MAEGNETAWGDEEETWRTVWVGVLRKDGFFIMQGRVFTSTVRPG